MVHGALGTQIKCPKCKGAIPEGAAFCSACGEKVLQHPADVERTAKPRPDVTTGQSIADPLIGAVVAERYIIRSMIGRGGMGVVYKVEHAKIGKIMALKLLSGPFARNPETVSRFKREAMMVSKLSHPNTVQVFDYGSAGGLTYLAMEYLNGQDLGQLVDQEGPQPFSVMAKIILQACGALKEAHEVGMVHRDLKPENIFLTRTPSGDELVKVLDFGLAKLRETADVGSITTTGNIVGTPYYMPPEQVRGEDVDPRGDIYSLCALFYTCITGTFLFDAPTPVGILTAQLTSEPEPPHLRAPDRGIPPGVSDLILRGLAKDPQHRYQTMAEFEQALHGELRGQSQASLHLPNSGYFKRPNDEEAATRDEVERYERTLRRRGQMARAALGLALTAGAFGVYKTINDLSRPSTFSGREAEPNQSVADATRVPFGQEVRGRLGKRHSLESSDQDNFIYVVPEVQNEGRTLVALKLSPLPNMRTCAWLFQVGVEHPLHQLCSGAEGRGVDIPQLELRAGKYLVAVKQDMNRYTEHQQNFVFENVSDDYVLSLARAPHQSNFEKEPNDDERSANAVALEGLTRLQGRLETVGDKDTICAQGAGAARFIVRDAEQGARPSHAALQVTPLGGPHDKIPVRIHGSRPTVETTERDRPSPWTSPPIDLDEGPCVALELVVNPWSSTPHPLLPPTSDHEWSVELVRADTPSEEDD